MDRRKTRLVRSLTVVFLLLTLLIYPTCAALRRHQNTRYLSQAVQDGTEWKVALLLSQGADPNGPIFAPPLTLTEMLRIALHQRRAQTDAESIVMYAAAGAEEPILRRLVEGGGDVSTRTREGDTALLEAAQEHRSRNLRLLVEKGAAINVISEKAPPTPLIAAMHYPPNLEDVAFLLAHGADPNLRSQDSYTPLMCAVSTQIPEMVRALLKRGAKVDACEASGRTALMMAADTGQIEMVTPLLDAGADPTLRSIDGRTAEQRALDNHTWEIAHLLHTYASHFHKQSR